jgi:microcin C transport system permease protein
VGVARGQDDVNIGLYIAKRLLLMLPTLFGVLLLTFAVIQFVPGGPVEQMVAQLRGKGQGGGEAAGGIAYRGRHGVDPQQIEEIRKLYGFDKPPAQRFVQMLGRFARFDLGRSYFYHASVWELIRQRMPVSITLGLWNFLLTYLISIPLGIAKAVRNGSRFDLATSVAVLVGYAIPGFVLGVLLLVLFAGGSFWQWFPLRGLTSDAWSSFSGWHKLTDYVWHVTLPVLAMVAGSFAVVTMLTKNAFLEELHKQYVLAARAKGAGRQRVLWRHVLRNALIPIVTGFPAAFIGAFFSGSLLIETLFSLPGLGLLSYESLLRRDYPVVMGTLYLFTLIGLFTKLVSDLCYIWVDPRVQFESLR